MTRFLLIITFGGMMVLLGSIYGILLDGENQEIADIRIVDEDTHVEVESIVPEQSTLSNDLSTFGKNLDDAVHRMIVQLVGK